MTYLFFCKNNHGTPDIEDGPKRARLSSSCGSFYRVFVPDCFFRMATLDTPFKAARRALHSWLGLGLRDGNTNFLKSRKGLGVVSPV